MLSQPREILKLRQATIQASSTKNQLDLRVVLTTQDTRERVPARALLDSGCTKTSIDASFVRRKRLLTRPTMEKRPVYNADGTLNGHIKEVAYLELEVRDADGALHRELYEFPVVNLGGKHDVFIGYDWLQKHNPLIDWTDHELVFARCPAECGMREDRYTPVRSLAEYSRAVQVGDYPADPRIAEHVRAYQSLATEIAMKTESERDSAEVPTEYRDFADVFAKAEFDRLPERKPWDHAIELYPGWETSRGLKGRVYPVSVAEQVELDAFLEENRSTGRIRPSKSPIAAPFFFVRKKDGKLRPVQDYRRVNAITKKDCWPLPLVSDIVARIKDAKFFSKMDVRWGYNNVRIKEGDEWKAAFITNRGLFEPLVMFFGLTNSPATFQHMMDDIFDDLIRANKVLVYMDDILVFSETREDHRAVVREVLTRLRQHGLYLKLEKCKFEKDEIDFLGLVIGGGRVSMDGAKVEAVRDWPRPKNISGVRSFVQFCNFYRSFVNDFAAITVPLNELLKKTVAWTWGEAQEGAFTRLKEEIAANVTLLIPVAGARFRLETDASDYAAGAVLHQVIDGKPRPLGFFSKTFNETERNYQIYDKEMLAVMWALANWRQYLRNSPEFDIWTDHMNLQFFREPQNLTRRQARWHTELAEYDFKMHHRPGSLNVVADRLSRNGLPEGGVKGDNSNVVLLEPLRFDSDKPNDLRRLSFRDNGEIMEEIRRRRTQRDEVVKVALRNHDPKYVETNGIVEVDTKVYVPRDRRLRDRIVHAHHDVPIAGHPGRFKTLELVRRTYWWPGMRSYIERYIRGCDVCQRTKPRHGPASAPLHPNPAPSYPWEEITIDLIGELPESAGYNAIMVVVDRHSKMCVIIPTSINQTSEGTARLFLNHVFKRFGIPKKVYSDRGTQFVSAFMRDFYKMVGVETNPSTAYHPQTDGQTERINAEVEKYLRAWISARQDDWAEWLPMAEFALNNRASEVTGASPFLLNHGRHPRTEITPNPSAKSESALEYTTRMEKSWQEAKAALEIVAEVTKARVDRRRLPAREYAIGDKVWLEATNLTSSRASKKLDDRRYGPFPIVKKVSLSAYKLKLPAGWSRIHPVFNEYLLTPYHAPVAAHQHRPLPPPPTVVGGEPEWEVEQILKVKKAGRQFKWLVRWKGYGRDDETWEPLDNLEHAKEHLADFYKSRPKAMRPKKVNDWLGIRRVTFPRELFPDHIWRPLTTGIDKSIPSERELLLWKRTQGARA